MKHALYIIVSLLLLSSCMSVDKATSYLQASGKLAEVCADKFPITERIIEGQTIVVLDTLLVAGDSVQCVPSPVPLKVKCPDRKVEVRHSYRVDTLIQENTAKVEMYKEKFFKQLDRTEQVESKLADTEGKLQAARKYKLYFYLALGGGIFVVLWPVLKRFSGLMF
jgi:hypothetical protein